MGRSVKTRLLTLGKGLKQDEQKKHDTRAKVTAEVLTITEHLVRRATVAQQQAVAWVEQQGDQTPRQVRRGSTGSP